MQVVSSMDFKNCYTMSHLLANYACWFVNMGNLRTAKEHGDATWDQIMTALNAPLAAQGRSHSHAHITLPPDAALTRPPPLTKLPIHPYNQHDITSRVEHLSTRFMDFIGDRID